MSKVQGLLDEYLGRAHKCAEPFEEDCIRCAAMAIFEALIADGLMKVEVRNLRRFEDDTHHMWIETGPGTDLYTCFARSGYVATQAYVLAKFGILVEHSPVVAS